MNYSNDFPVFLCDHELDDPTCTCNLESIIENNKRIKLIANLFFDGDEALVRDEYYSNQPARRLINIIFEFYGGN